MDDDIWFGFMTLGLGVLLGFLVYMLLDLLPTPQTDLCDGLHYIYDVATSVINHTCYVEVKGKFVLAETLINLGK